MEKVEGIRVSLGATRAVWRYLCTRVQGGPNTTNALDAVKPYFAKDNSLVLGAESPKMQAQWKLERNDYLRQTLQDSEAHVYKGGSTED